MTPAAQTSAGMMHQSEAPMTLLSRDLVKNRSPTNPQAISHVTIAHAIASACSDLPAFVGIGPHIEVELSGIVIFPVGRAEVVGVAESILTY